MLATTLGSEWVHTQNEQSGWTDMNSGSRSPFKNCNVGAGNMAPELRALADLLQDPDSIPRMHMAAHNCL